jgi:diguanylate cyclase (GGDEF)-like protein
MIDLDYFKHVNDSHGHAAGDKALRAVADVLTGQATRLLDSSARWGGEEFVVVWYDVNRDDAQKLAERVRSAVEGLRFSNEIGGRQFLTVSIGVYTCRPKPSDNADECLSYADQAQYQAKQGGRNRVVVI